MFVSASRRFSNSLALFIGVIAALLLFVFLPLHPQPNANAKLGFTFSIHAARYLGLDPDVALKAAVTDLKPALVRIPAYWDLVEAEQGRFDWSAMDRQLDILKAGDSHAMLAIGAKLPRWPECHLPEWMIGLDDASAQQATRDYVSAAVSHFSGNETVAIWQVENEALFPFGECPSWSSDRDFLKSEIELVRGLDATRDIYTSDSGELSLWWRTASLPVDGIAISLYRAVYNQRVIRWRVNPYFYRVRLAIIRPFVKHFMISELETEPWGPMPVDQLTQADIDASFTPAELAQRIRFARETGAEAVLAWGVEWWYYRLIHDQDMTYWNAAKNAFMQ